SLTLYVPAASSSVTWSPSPASAITVTPLTVRVKRPGSLFGQSRFSTVRCAGTQLPKLRPVALGVVATEIGPQPQPKSPPGPFANPPDVPALGYVPRQPLAAALRPAPVASVSRSR